MTIESFWNELKKYKDFALFCHVRPDGDSVGSAIALKLALEKKGFFANVFCEDAVPEKFFFIKGASEIKNDIDREYACYVAVDCSEIRRLGKFSNLFESGKCNTFNIDHHVSNTHYAKNNAVFDRSANSENIYELILNIGVDIDCDIATALLTGISTDTGNFGHKNTNENTLEVAAKLVKIGADINDIYYRMFKKQSKARAKLFGTVMSKIRYFNDDKIGIVSIMKSDIADAGATADMTEGFIDFLLGVDTVEIAICLLEVKDRQYKVSFRSKGADVNEVAGVFGGGGHILASGCMISGYYEDVIDRLVYACKQRMN